MTRDEIVQIAWDCGILMRSHQHQDEPTKLERFAERIAAAEREQCKEWIATWVEDWCEGWSAKKIAHCIRGDGNDIEKPNKYVTRKESL